MIRMIFTYVVPLVLPTVMFYIWSAWMRRRLAQQHATEEEAKEAFRIKTPWFRLLLTGLGLMVLGLILSVILSPKNPPNSVYQAPRIQNGRVLPGEYIPAK